MSPPERIETLVLSGGGMKGVVTLGAVAGLRRSGALKHVRRVVGTSAGALVAAALALDRASSGLVDDLGALRYEPDMDLGRLLVSFGLDSGRHLDAWIATLLGGETLTFAEVRRRSGLDLIVCVTNLTQRRAEYFGPDTSPDMDVALALRMSCAIPLYFAAVPHASQLFVDGGVADNFPIEWACDRYGEHTAVGMCFRSAGGDPGRAMADYVAALLESTYARRRAQTIARGCVLQLDAGGASTFDFGMPRRRLRKLYYSGYRQARQWHKKQV